MPRCLKFHTKCPERRRGRHWNLWTKVEHKKPWAMFGRLESKEQRLIDRMDDSVEWAAEKAVGGWTTELHGQMQDWESQMDTQMQTQMQSHWGYFEKSKFVQLELRAKDGVITAAELRVWMSVQTEIKPMDGKDGGGRQDFTHLGAGVFSHMKDFRSSLWLPRVHLSVPTHRVLLVHLLL